MHLKTMLYVVMLSAAPAFAASTEWSVGTEAYRETYREYENGTERLMQQRGNMWSSMPA